MSYVALTSIFFNEVLILHIVISLFIGFFKNIIPANFEGYILY